MAGIKITRDEDFPERITAAANSNGGAEVTLSPGTDDLQPPSTEIKAAHGERLDSFFFDPERTTKIKGSQNYNGSTYEISRPEQVSQVAHNFGIDATNIDRINYTDNRGSVTAMTVVFKDTLSPDQLASANAKLILQLEKSGRLPAGTAFAIGEAHNEYVDAGKSRFYDEPGYFRASLGPGHNSTGQEFRIQSVRNGGTEIYLGESKASGHIVASSKDETAAKKIAAAIGGAVDAHNPGLTGVSITTPQSPQNVMRALSQQGIIGAEWQEHIQPVSETHSPTPHFLETTAGRVTSTPGHGQSGTVLPLANQQQEPLPLAPLQHVKHQQAAFRDTTLSTPAVHAQERAPLPRHLQVQQEIEAHHQALRAAQRSAQQGVAAARNAHLRAQAERQSQTGQTHRAETTHSSPTGGVSHQQSGAAAPLQPNRFNHQQTTAPTAPRQQQQQQHQFQDTRHGADSPGPTSPSPTQSQAPHPSQPPAPSSPPPETPSQVSQSSPGKVQVVEGHAGRAMGAYGLIKGAVVTGVALQHHDYRKAAQSGATTALGAAATFVQTNKGAQIVLTVAAKVAPKIIRAGAEDIPVVGAVVAGGFAAYELGSAAIGALEHKNSWTKVGSTAAANAAEIGGGLIGFGAGQAARQGVVEISKTTLGKDNAAQDSAAVGVVKDVAGLFKSSGAPSTGTAHGIPAALAPKSPQDLSRIASNGRAGLRTQTASARSTGASLPVAHPPASPPHTEPPKAPSQATLASQTRVRRSALSHPAV